MLKDGRVSVIKSATPRPGTAARICTGIKEGVKDAAVELLAAAGIALLVVGIVMFANL